MECLKIILLAVIQGVAEFLPISSSGHLAVLGTLFGFDPEENLAIGIVLHAGTLLAILIFYLKTLLKFFRKDHLWLAAMILLGSVPAGIFGVALKLTGAAENVFHSLWIAGGGFLITATLLLWSEKNAAQIQQNADTEEMPLEKISVKQTLLIGCAQALAVLPGVSRSGSTISAGLFSKLPPAAAAEFSFLLAIPAIGGAALLEVLDICKDGTLPAENLWLLLAGFAASAAVGYVSLALLLKLLKKGKLAIFSWYLYALGTAVILWNVIQ